MDKSADLNKQTGTTLLSKLHLCKNEKMNQQFINLKSCSSHSRSSRGMGQTAVLLTFSNAVLQTSLASVYQYTIILDSSLTPTLHLMRTSSVSIFKQVNVLLNISNVT